MKVKRRKKNDRRALMASESFGDVMQVTVGEVPMRIEPYSLTVRTKTRRLLE